MKVTSGSIENNSPCFLFLEVWKGTENLAGVLGSVPSFYFFRRLHLRTCVFPLFFLLPFSYFSVCYPPSPSSGYGFFIAGSITSEWTGSSSAYPKHVSKYALVLSTPQPRISVKIKLLPDYQYLALCLYQPERSCDTLGCWGECVIVKCVRVQQFFFTYTLQ